jgi:hypothetical protein
MYLMEVNETALAFMEVQEPMTYHQRFSVANRIINP